MTENTLRENAALLAGKRVEIREHFTGAGAVKLTRVPATEARGKRFRWAIVGQHSKKNLNGRIYPESEWRAQIERANRELIPAGTLIGAVDHAGCLEGGNLRSSPIIWRKLEMAGGNLIGGEFEIVEKHSAGRDLIALIEAGFTPGFSTVGFAEAREPTAQERTQYGLTPSERCVVIQDWTLTKVDCVDGPSVTAARMRGESALPAAVEAVREERDAVELPAVAAFAAELDPQPGQPLPAAVAAVKAEEAEPVELSAVVALAAELKLDAPKQSKGLTDAMTALANTL